MAVSLCLLGLPLTAGLFLGIQLGGGKIGLLLEQNIENLQDELADQRSHLEESKKIAAQREQAMSLKMAEMQARLLRLDALGQRLTALAGLDDGEFDFASQPPVGGPEVLEELLPDGGHDLLALYSELESQLESREQQLNVLESLLINRQIDQETRVAGRPVEKGWISSTFGVRTDPFNGARRWHKGVDFAAATGANVLAVGSGVVTWSGKYEDYGNMVEIDHGEGYVTRYAHNDENKVKVGELVERGQVIAALGSTGRSTGPHLHFEVYKNGRAVDPSSYIRKTLR